METILKFKKQLVYEDKQQIKAAVDSLKSSAEEMNGSFDKIATAMDRELSIKDKEDILSKGFDWVLDILRKQFPHPNSDDEMNLRLMGIDLGGMPIIIQTMRYKNKNQGIVLDGAGNAIVSKDMIKMVTEKNRYYTKSENQNKALSIAKDICKFLNANSKDIMSFAPGLFSNQSKAIAIAEGFDIVEVEKQNSGYKFVPNINSILKK